MTSKSPRAVAREALQVGKKAFSKYSHEFSPKRFTQGQLFACLVLKTFMNLDYRGLQAFLLDSPKLSEEIGLVRIPHYTTFQKACRRLLKQNTVPELLQVTVRRHKEVKGGKAKRPNGQLLQSQRSMPQDSRRAT